jgi:hypothetical protein
VGEKSVGDYGQSIFPQEYANSILHGCAYVAWLCQKSGALKNGQTALYWHLIGTVAEHMKGPE